MKNEKIEIINKFSAPKSTVLITNEELPEEIWIGDKAKLMVKHILLQVYLFQIEIHL